MDDMLKRLRARTVQNFKTNKDVPNQYWPICETIPDDLCTAAADEIEKMAEALKKIADFPSTGLSSSDAYDAAKIARDAVSNISH